MSGKLMTGQAFALEADATKATLPRQAATLCSLTTGGTP